MPANAAVVVSLSVAGAAMSPFLVRYASRRAAAQPVSYDATAERQVLAGAYTDPTLVAELAEAGVHAGCFADTGRSQAWQALVDAVEVHGAGTDAAAAAAATLDTGIVTPTESGSTVDLAAMGRSTSRLLDAADDRERYPGRLPLERCADGPPRRVPQRPAAARYAVAAATMAAFGALAGMWAGGPLTAAVLVLLGAYAYCSATIDHDTLLVDSRTVVVGTLAGWGLLAVAAAAGEISWSKMVLAAVVTVGWVVIFEIINAAYKLLRHIDGIGFGDALLLPVCIGVPTAVSGSVWVGGYAVIAAFALAGVVTLPLVMLKRRSRTDPFALGPFLAVGWVASWATAAAMGLL
jgi:prepilin signal peptidase PulO-like enzyme (type II secretory pathway)